MDSSSRISRIRSRELERLRGPPWLKVGNDRHYSIAGFSYKYELSSHNLQQDYFYMISADCSEGAP